MRDGSRKTKKIALLLAGALVLSLCSAPALAVGETQPEPESVIDTAELDGIIGGYIEDNGLDAEYVSVGYCHTASGGEYYRNADAWFYSASIYKVPLMMVFAEKEYLGELTGESIVAGLKLEQLEEYVLVNSNNEFAYAAMDGFESYRACRELYRAYAPELEDDYYDSRFYSLSFFTARFMTKVMTTLQSDPERFPNVLDCLKRAQPDGYFRRTCGEYEIAQKYGAYEECQHAAAIIYASSPIVVTVMTRYTANYPKVIADIGRLLTDYTVELDARLADEAAAAEAERLEAERLAALEESRLAQERAQAEEQAAREAAAAAEAERLEAERMEAERLAALEESRLAQEQELAEKAGRERLIVLCALAVLFAAALVVTAVRGARRRSRGRTAAK